MAVCVWFQAEERVCRATDWSSQVARALELVGEQEQGQPGQPDSVLGRALTCVLRRVEALLDYRPAALGPKVCVSLVSNHKHHLQSSILAEVRLIMATHPRHSYQLIALQVKTPTQFNPSANARL